MIHFLFPENKTAGGDPSKDHRQRFLFYSSASSLVPCKTCAYLSVFIRGNNTALGKD